MQAIKLSPDERAFMLANIEEAEKVQIALALKDPWFFCTNFVYTLDEHDAKNPVKKFPDYSYLELITEVWKKNTKLLVPKSRQMMLSWLMVALHVWLALHKGQSIYFQSKKEDDSNGLLDRAKFIYNHLPIALKWGKVDSTMQVDLKKNPPVRDIYCNLEFPWLNSNIRAVAQGPDVLRSRTASAILSDEMAFQDQACLAYEASKPTIDGGGRYTGVSTPNGQECFYDLVFDINR